MNIFKKAICLSMCAVLIFSLSACKKDSSQNDNSTTVSNNNPYTDFTINNTSVKDIMDRLSETTLNDGLSLSLINDGTDQQFHSFVYEIKDSEGNKRATVTASSDLENKAAQLKISWNYNETSDTLNASLVAACKTIVIAAWPNYSEEAMAVVEKTVRFDTSFFNAFSDETRVYTANASTGGFISGSISGGHIFISVCYPNLIENV